MSHRTRSRSPSPSQSRSASTSTATSLSSSDLSSIYDGRFDDEDPPSVHPNDFDPQSSRSLASHVTARGPRSIGLGPSTAPSPREVARKGKHPLHYAFAQAFGEPVDYSPMFVHDADVISAVSFNHQSDLVAAGDKGGRIMIVKRVWDSDGASIEPFSAVCLQRGRELHNKRGRRKARIRGRINYSAPLSGPYHDADSLYPPEDMDKHGDDGDKRRQKPPEFRFWTQFQSHEPEFDYLKSMEIEEKINQIRWCRETSGAQRLVATNDKTIKLWRISEHDVKTTAVMDPASLFHPRNGKTSQSSSRPSTCGADIAHRLSTPPQSAVPSDSPKEYELRIPKLEARRRVIIASPRKTFSNAHAYHINSISLNNDEETFLSADDLRVNLWNLNAGGSGFNILDIKPGHLEDLTEVITCAEFHPKHCHLFMYSSSRGMVKLCDLRQSALCQSWVREFEKPAEDEKRASFFSEIIASISDVKFSPCGRYILTRDFMNLRLWDIHMETEPILVVPVHEHLRYRLCDLYDNDCIFDKFQCCFSNDGGSLMTGSYNSLFHSYSAYSGVGTAVEAHADFVSGVSDRYHFSPQGYSTIGNDIRQCSASELGDPTKRIMYVDASRTEPIAAAAAGAALYMYSQQPGRTWYG